MILQNLVWDMTGEYGSPEMFVRGNVRVCGSASEKACLVIPEGEQLSFDTYFNLFSLKKWKRYTKISEAAVSFALKGAGTATLVGIGEKSADGSRREYILDSAFYDSTHSANVSNDSISYNSASGNSTSDSSISDNRTFHNSVTRLTLCADKNTPDNDTIAYCYLRLEALRETWISEGAYECREEAEKGEGRKLRPVKIACCICTYRREEYVRRNVKLIWEKLLCAGSPMEDSLEIFVVDNGNTLRREMLETEMSEAENISGEQPEKIHLIANRNYGGSAGFTRGMLEAAIYRRNQNFTHVLLMDDDIQIYPEVLFRTRAFLQMLWEEYQGCILGGAMLLLGQRNIQAESCGHYDVMNGYNRPNPRNGMDLNLRDNIIKNEEETDANFSGWWYSCIPTSMIRDGNLPLPLFLHRDDQDYGVRSEREILQLNGICIWHPSPAGKHADNINYYDMRNMLIAMMDLCPDKLTKKHLKRYLISESIKKLLGYRYRGASMLLLGCEAFLNGPEEFMKLDPEALHRELLQKCKIDWIDLKEASTEIKKLSEEQRLPVWTKIFRYLKPDNRTCRVEGGCNYPSYLGYKRVIYMDESMGKGYLLKRSFSETVKLLFRVIRTYRSVDRRLEEAKNAWVRALPEFRSLLFWEKYLQLK